MCDAVIIGQVKFGYVNDSQKEYLKGLGASKCKCRKNDKPVEQVEEVVEVFEVVEESVTVDVAEENDNGVV